MKSNCEKVVFMIDMNIIDLITDNHNTPLWCRFLYCRE